MSDHERQPKLEPQLSKVFHSDVDRKQQAPDLQKRFVPVRTGFQKPCPRLLLGPVPLLPRTGLLLVGLMHLVLTPKCLVWMCFEKPGLKCVGIRSFQQ